MHKTAVIRALQQLHHHILKIQTVVYILNCQCSVSSTEPDLYLEWQLIYIKYEGFFLAK